MADATWFEIQGDPSRYPNIEAVKTAAREAAKKTDSVIEIYRVTRTLVRTVQRNSTFTETDVPTA
jgi:hypothetical protein